MTLIITPFFVLEAALFLLAATYVYFQWAYKFWKRQGVPSLTPSFPFGNQENPFRRTNTQGVALKHIYEQFKAKGCRYGGTYAMTVPSITVIDPDIIRSVIAKDFTHFTDHGLAVDPEKEILTAHLFNLEGAKWRNMRVKLTPTFTSGKMKMMFQTLVDCSGGLVAQVGKLAEDEAAIDIKDALGCFTTDVIGSCAFGLECNSFNEEAATFRTFGRKIFEFNAFTNAKGVFLSLFPKLGRSLGLRFTSKEVETFFMKAVKDTVDYRAKNGVVRKDFLQLLMDLGNKGKDSGENGLTIEEMTAQSFVFFVAGFETSSTLMTFCLYELSLNPDIQQKVRDEIQTVLQKFDGQITYEATQEMTYMQQVLDETLRKYPPLPQLNRRCTMDFTIPKSDVVLKTGTRVEISILGLHYDPEHFKDPEKFDPERFSSENKPKIRPFTYLPFGDGPRNCIGLRFGLMQSKVGLTVLLKNFEFTVNEKTKLPLAFAAGSFLLSTEGGMWLSARRLKDTN